MITHGNLFSGSGAWELAAQLCDIKTLWEAEIEPFAVQIEAARFPDAIQLGDVTKIDGSQIAPVDIMTNSSPCQGLSSSGHKLGLSDERSGLFSEAIRICKEMREAEIERHREEPRPHYWCWENVTGALTSSGDKHERGADFKAVLESIVSIVQKNTPIYLSLREDGTIQASWTEIVGKLPGELLMHKENCRNGEDEYLLSHLLTTEAPEQFYLSRRALTGILKRLQIYGKTIPSLLIQALIEQAGLSEEEYQALILDAKPRKR